MYNFNYKKNDRFIPMAYPFLLGALTGGATAYVLSPKQKMPYYSPYPYYPYY